jgi:hypothetical protein
MTINEFNWICQRMRHMKWIPPCHLVYEDFAVELEFLNAVFKSADTALRNEFFEANESALSQNKTFNISLSLLIVSPFREEDAERFQRLVFTAIDKLEQEPEAVDIFEVGRFLWVMLDHMLHEWIISDHDALITKLKAFRRSLPELEARVSASEFPDSYLGMLDQKIGHFC